MVRQIIVPQESVVTVQLPKEMVGKKIEVLVFEIGDEPQEAATKEEFYKLIDEITAASRVDLRHFRFDRDEANNYDE